LSKEINDKSFRVHSAVSFGKHNDLETAKELSKISSNFSTALKKANENPGKYIFAEPFIVKNIF
jgi:hypothetical protein